jgi:alpha-N-arabinofuranosidase
MKLWREHFGPERVALEGAEAPLNVVASRSVDGKTVYVKAVNPSDEPLDVAIVVGADFPVGRARFQVVAPGSLRARNTLDRPETVQAKDAAATVDGTRIRVALPALSAGVVTIHAR